jgi:hypothetical protein
VRCDEKRGEEVGERTMNSATYYPLHTRHQLVVAPFTIPNQTKSHEWGTLHIVLEGIRRSFGDRSAFQPCFSAAPSLVNNKLGDALLIT